MLIPPIFINKFGSTVFILFQYDNYIIAHDILRNQCFPFFGDETLTVTVICEL